MASADALTTKVEEQSSTAVYRRLLRYLKPHRKPFFIALLAMVVYGATDGAVPLLIRSILDDIFGARNEQMLYFLPILVVVFAFIRGVFGFIQRYLAARVGLAVVRDLRDEINAHLLRLSPGFYSGTSAGALISRMTNDTLLVRTALTDAATVILRDSIRVVALMAVALYLDTVLALIAIVGLPLGMYPVIRFGKRIRRLSRFGQDQFGGLTSTLQQMIAGHKVVQSFGRESHEQQRFADENENFTRTFQKAEKYGALSGPTNEAIASIAIAAVIMYGGFSVISGVRTQGDFIAFLMSLFLLYEPVKKLSRTNATVQLGVAAAERIFEILDTKPDITDSVDAVELITSNPVVEFQQVSFGYPAREGGVSEQTDAVLWALRDVSFSIEAGKTLALVGMSGGGKSTLVNLLPRFYDPQEGTVRINGKDIRDYTLCSLRQSISMVDQHTFLFNDSVLNNIRYGRLEASEAEVVEVAKAAYAHEFIMRLDHGYKTEVGEQGFRLSGGERARLAIARALLKNAPILVLDEATAALDSEAEHVVQAAIERLMQGRTVLVIAHRLATIQKADYIAVIQSGRVVEFGSHQELLSKDADYAKLYRMQFENTAPNSAVNQ